ncbi:MAG: dolichol-phosphate mannosyltransferase [Pseudohongiellaceae bacterium]|jgi:dolichol-phosphate mannosyltransferase
MNKIVSILVPVNNEEMALPALFAELDRILKPLSKKYQFHVLILDDGSVDKTAGIVRGHTSRFYSTGLCSFTRNFGKESAISAGLDRCESDAYIIIDADLQHPPELIPEMLIQWESGYKLVECVKKSRGKESFLYKICSQLFYRSMKSLSSLELDNDSDYKLLDKEIVLVIRGFPEKNRFFRGLVSWMGYPTYQIPFEVPNREQGKSSWKMWGLIKYSLSSLSSFSSAPLQLVTVIGVLMLILSLLIGSLTLYQWALGNAVTGFTTVIILLLMIGSMLMISLGLIGLYIAKIYEEVKSRPSYVVKEELISSANHSDKVK